MDTKSLVKENYDLMLSRTECNIMRGLAILLIVANNFGHLVKGVHPDNEYLYEIDSVYGFVDSLMNPSSILPLELLSFYSPFGVMLFIFLSGYGLVLKYERGNVSSVTHWIFVSDHYKKLFVMQTKGLALFLLFNFLCASAENVYFWPFIKQLFMVENLNPSFKIMPGPYWFFGMILEIYIIYRFFFYRRPTWLMLAIVALSVIVMLFLEPNGKTIMYLRINFCLALLPFSLGVLAARYWPSGSMLFDSKIKVLLMFIISFVLLTICKFNFYSWLFMPLFIIATSITMVKLLNGVKSLTHVLGWLGGLSGVMFVVHPALRQLLIARANESGHCYTVLFVYLFLTIVLSVMLKPVFSKK